LNGPTRGFHKAGRRKEKTDDVQLILQLLEREYQASHRHAKIDAYRQNAASIRVRIVDPDFEGSNRVERNRRISQLLQQLSEHVESQITQLLLLKPEVTKISFANLEFNHPVPAAL
jgi:stress-induced morphogen